MRGALAVAAVVLRRRDVVAVARGCGRLGAAARRRRAFAALGALAGEALVALTVRLAAPGVGGLQRVPLGVPVAVGPARPLRSAARAVVGDRRAVVAREPRRVGVAARD